jgi:acetyltransferase
VLRHDHPLDPIFHPRAVAVVGVSTRPSFDGQLGGIFLNAILEQGYQERHPLYAVNPKMTEVRGVPCYPSVLDIPGPVDHVISQIPAAGLERLVDECIAKGVRSLHSFTAGLAETGEPELVAEQDRIVAKARAAGMRLVGPNCMGLYVPGVGLSFMPRVAHEPGNVFMLSQSGANASAMLYGLGRRGLRFSKGVSYGNGADLRAHDFLDYAAADPQTEYVVGYIEGVQDGRKFLSALRKLATVKPTILLKGGITSDGARAANSHTGSLAGSIEVFEALCRQTGAWHAPRMDDLLDLATVVTSYARIARGRNVTLIGAGGGTAVLASDQLALHGLRVPPLPEAVQEELRGFIPVAGTSVRNPVDATFGRDHPLDFTHDRELTERAFETIVHSPTTDMVFTTVGGSFLRDETVETREHRMRATIDEFAAIQRRSGVPIVMIHEEQRVGNAAVHAHRRGVALMPSIERAARAVAELMEWREVRAGLPAFA